MSSSEKPPPRRPGCIFLVVSRSCTQTCGSRESERKRQKNEKTINKKHVEERRHRPRGELRAISASRRGSLDESTMRNRISLPRHSTKNRRHWIALIVGRTLVSYFVIVIKSERDREREKER